MQARRRPVDRGARSIRRVNRKPLFPLRMASIDKGCDKGDGIIQIRARLPTRTVLKQERAILNSLMSCEQVNVSVRWLCPRED